MPLSLKDRGGRLQAFARKNSDSAANYNASAPKSDTLVETGSDTPQDPSHAPTRQELAEAARLSLPANYRNGASHQQHNGQITSHARLASPPHVSQTSPTSHPARGSSGHHHHPGLFSGSQLGDSFMNSGLSTPLNEPEEGSEGEATPNAKGQSNRGPQAHVQNSSRGFQSAPPPAAFRIGENLMMSVVPGADRRGLPQMMDGFHDDAVLANRRQPQSYRPHHDRSSAAAAVQPKLPVRETPSPSPSIESTHWPGRRNLDDARQSAPAHDLDEELDSLSAHEGPPKMAAADKPRGGTRRFREGSPVPANIALQKLPRERKRRRGSPDYDDRMLSSMSFSDLTDEPFDLDPGKATAQGGQDASAKLPLKLEQYRQQGEKEQQHMFAAMALDDWEAAGDWFVDQFSGIMTQLRDARRSKRRMVQGFEDEAARREEAVRLRSETIDRKLAKMRQDGQRVVDDKSL
ncbi:extracellular mutant protein 11 domain-containing protein [Hirsutella rhossiliensis]|uniref:Extracellular mutant protein 11 domain-containing protein n=1 Tax=Hirsutella rhossiliensis TaxID=111463 RepID=A0A9P8N6G7_9HYPO|nr:extracellular mutant protein 11 domain-containing protein [Hirsutella rhossiliensis]KAH0965532.1 extracellular mutant protein 11 domain-containing protein [Hirsutella rhossiliensis]